MKTKLPLSLALIGLQLADVLSTNYGLAHGAHEANPLMAWIMTMCGDFWWWPKALLLGLIIVMILAYKGRQPIVCAAMLCGLYSIVVVNNLLGLL